MKIISIASARPNFVKLAAVHHALKNKPGVEHIIIHTGQHYDPMLSDVFFQQLQIAQPKHNLGIRGSDREEVIESTMQAAAPILRNERPDWVLVYGDVNGAVGGALAAKETGCRVAHIEAGLRSFDMDMPEEHNRMAIDQLSDLLLCSEESGMLNLRQEDNADGAYLVGNTMIDTLLRMLPDIRKMHPSVNTTQPFAIATLHRPSNVDNASDLQKVLDLIGTIASSTPVVLPVHPRTKEKLSGAKNTMHSGITIIDPLPYAEFIRLLSASAFILTDSGGIQEEAVILQKRCFTLRKNTERPATIGSGSNVLIDIDKPEDRQKVLDYAANPQPINVRIPELWDGHAGERIAEILLAA